MRKRVTGIVTSTKMQKTIRVEIPRIVRHPRYGKYLRAQTVCFAHDPHEQAAPGDLVELIESRPISKTKRWQLIRVIQRGAEPPSAEEEQPAEATLEASAQPPLTQE